MARMGSPEGYDAEAGSGEPAQKPQSGEPNESRPISKQRDEHLQTVPIEAAKLAPRWNEQLAELHDRELKRGDRDRATLALARKLVAYSLAVDKSGKRFEVRNPVKEKR